MICLWRFWRDRDWSQDTKELATKMLGIKGEGLPGANVDMVFVTPAAT